MDRLDIEYDFLPRESEILHLHFWDAAFTKLKEAGVLFFETEGKNKGCWVMRRAGTGKKPETADGTEDRESKTKSPKKTRKSSCAPTAPSATSAKTLPTTCGSSACWAATSDTASSIAIPTSITAGSRRPRARPIIRTSATWPKSTTSSTPASPRRKTRSSKRCAAWATTKRPTTTRIFPTRWSRSPRAAPPNSATSCPTKTRRAPTSKSPAAKALA